MAMIAVEVCAAIPPGLDYLAKIDQLLVRKPLVEVLEGERLGM